MSASPSGSSPEALALFICSVLQSLPDRVREDDCRRVREFAGAASEGDDIEGLDAESSARTGEEPDTLPGSPRR